MDEQWRPVDRPNREVLHRARVPVDRDILLALENHDDVWRLAYRLLAEGGVYLTLSSTVLVNENGEPFPYSRNGAVLVGCLIRAFKLVRSFCQLIESGNGYGAKVLERPIHDSLMTMLYLVRKPAPEEFDQFVRGGLGNIKRGLEMVREADCANHTLIPVLQSSIDYIFQSAGFTFEEIDCKKDRQWSVNARDKFDTVCDAPYCGVSAEEVAALEYLTCFAGPSGNVHGDWADLILNHLKPVEGGFLPDMERGWPEPDRMVSLAQYVGGTLSALFNCVLPETEDTAWISAHLKEYLGRVDAVENYMKHPSALDKVYPGERAGLGPQGGTSPGKSPSSSPASPP
jgi:hypothetical protein